jgi:TATA-box binding protein (TBP) (component of TFIID and TFIIIB)
MKTPKAVFLIFSSGRIVCAGTNKESITRKAIYMLAEHMRSLGLIDNQPSPEQAAATDKTTKTTPTKSK